MTDSAGQPYTALPTCDVVRTLRTVGDCLPMGRQSLPTASPDWTAVELAELMALSRRPLIAVVEQPDEGSGRLLGVATATCLLERLLQSV